MFVYHRSKRYPNHVGTYIGLFDWKKLRGVHIQPKSSLRPGPSNRRRELAIGETYSAQPI